MKKSELEIKEKEGFKAGILRLMDTLHDECARYIMAGSRQHVSVHEFRKNIKKIRSLLRLIRDEIGSQEYREMNALYREVSKKIAVLRDDTSQVELLESMRKQVKNNRIREVIAGAASQVKKKRKREFERFYREKHHMDVYYDILVLKEKVHDLGFEGYPESFIILSLKRIHKRASSAMEITGFLKNDEIYHYLRKQVKYLMYHMMILNRAWPQYFRVYISELNKLSDQLGDLHDLNLFNQHIHKEKLFVLKPEQKKLMLKHIYRKRALLQKSIKRAGEKLFSESSEHFSMTIFNFWMNSAMKSAN